ncbi:hypothetical protein CDD83_4301 [Cordyceps sp. RAO-2017]|nr:hypothetical protein CDD83_4301 [Cordyceps sp. RAO-2017]
MSPTIESEAAQARVVVRSDSQLARRGERERKGEREACGSLTVRGRHLRPAVPDRQSLRCRAQRRPLAALGPNAWCARPISAPGLALAEARPVVTHMPLAVHVTIMTRREAQSLRGRLGGTSERASSASPAGSANAVRRRLLSHTSPRRMRLLVNAAERGRTSATGPVRCSGRRLKRATSYAWLAG